jgi:drug/metabolite transporter (DMT)-like permease
MNLRAALLLTLAAILAAAGQMLLKAGADGNVALTQYFNWRILTGVGLYGVGTLLWIYCLSFAPLVAVYTFTALTFVLVYAGSVAFLGEKPNVGAITGSMIVLIGLAMVLLNTGKVR